MRNATALVSKLRTSQRFRIGREKFVDIMDELPDLFAKHYEEVVTDKNGLKEDPDWDRYISLENLGVLHCMTVRHRGKLIGYFVSMVVPHLHHKGLLLGSSDLIYVLPEYRKGTGAGLALLRATIKEMKKIGVKKMYIGTKKDTRLAETVRRLGFQTIEEIHSMWIGA